MKKKVSEAEITRLFEGWDPDVAVPPPPKKPAHEEIADIFGDGKVRQEPVKRPVPVRSEFADIFDDWEPPKSDGAP